MLIQFQEYSDVKTLFFLTLVPAASMPIHAVYGTVINYFTISAVSLALERAQVETVRLNASLALAHKWNSRT